jgi:hypothetical protein
VFRPSFFFFQKALINKLKGSDRLLVHFVWFLLLSQEEFTESSSYGKNFRQNKRERKKATASFVCVAPTHTRACHHQSVTSFFLTF